MNDHKENRQVTKPVDPLDELELELPSPAAKPTLDPLDEIFAEATGPKQVWRPVANVALIYQQRCRSCDAKHEFFMGFFTEQLHSTDKFTRRLVAGRSPGLPALVERQSQGLVDYCPNCVEAQIIIDNAAERAK